MRTLVEMVQSRHTDQWAERHARGEVPDAWPYGLNRLAAHGIEPVWPSRPHGLSEGLGRAVAKAAGAGFLDSWTAPVRDIDARLCWAERTGIPAALDPRTRGVPVVSGIIWATDPQAPKRARVLLRRVLQKRNFIVFVNSRGQLGPLREISSWRLESLPFGVDTGFWYRSNDPDPGSLVVVSAGNERHRDFETLIRGALKHLKNRLILATSVQIDREKRLDVGPRDHSQLRALFHEPNVVSLAPHPNDHCSGLTITLKTMRCGRPVVAGEEFTERVRRDRSLVDHEARLALGADRRQYLQRKPCAGPRNHRGLAHWPPRVPGVVVRAHARHVGEKNHGVFRLGLSLDRRKFLAPPLFHPRQILRMDPGLDPAHYPKAQVFLLLAGQLAAISVALTFHETKSYPVAFSTHALVFSTSYMLTVKTQHNNHKG